ncbi:hypothetical protein KIL84_005456 [Mauremys mutica]|uniref:Uncharacterized protein n=1 Tax=Mauremys mutica TaxID=74926 RepID=A0A9D3XMD6_9SAUR|nr:hypothetical protein KIL84_005456 [Mauremys mutica]
MLEGSPGESEDTEREALGRKYLGWQEVAIKQLYMTSPEQGAGTGAGYTAHKHPCSRARSVQTGGYCAPSIPQLTQGPEASLQTVCKSAWPSAAPGSGATNYLPLPLHQRPLQHRDSSPPTEMPSGSSQESGAGWVHRTDNWRCWARRVWALSDCACCRACSISKGASQEAARQRKPQATS